MQFANVNKYPILQSVDREDRATIRGIKAALAELGAELPTNFDYRSGKHLIKTALRPMPLDELINCLTTNHPELFEDPDLHVDSSAVTARTFGVLSSDILDCFKQCSTVDQISFSPDLDMLAAIIEHKDVLNAEEDEPEPEYDEDEDEDSCRNPILNYEPVLPEFICNDELRLRLQLLFGDKHPNNAAHLYTSGTGYELSHTIFEHNRMSGEEALSGIPIAIFDPAEDDEPLLPLHVPLSDSEQTSSGLQAIVVSDRESVPDNIKALIQTLTCYTLKVNASTIYFVEPNPNKEQRALLNSIYKAAASVSELYSAAAFGSLGRNPKSFSTHAIRTFSTVERKAYETALDDDLSHSMYDIVTVSEALYLQACSFLLPLGYTIAKKDTNISFPRVRAILRWIAED